MTTFSFKKHHRLLTPSTFTHVFDKPDSKLHQAHLMAFIRSNELPHPRIGMAITKRKVPKAISRNTIKRHIRENFRLHADELKNVDIVFIVKKYNKDLDSKTIDKEIKTILNKIKNVSQ